MTTDQDDLRNAEQARDHHSRMAKEKFGAARKRQLRLVQEYENQISAIKTRIAKAHAQGSKRSNSQIA